MPDRLDEAARALQFILDRVGSVAASVRQHIPLVQAEIGRLFPYGLSAAEIAADLAHARRAFEAIRTALSHHRLGSARAKLATATEKLATCSGRISQAIAEFLSVSVGDPERPASAIADEWTALLAELRRVRNLRGHLDSVERVAAAITNSGAPDWAQSLRTRQVEGIEDSWTPDDWHDAWIWAQADAHLRAIDGRARLRQLDEQRRGADEEIRHLFPRGRAAPYAAHAQSTNNAPGRRRLTDVPHRHPADRQRHGQERIAPSPGRARRDGNILCSGAVLDHAKLADFRESPSDARFLRSRDLR